MAFMVGEESCCGPTSCIQHYIFREISGVNEHPIPQVQTSFVNDCIHKHFLHHLFKNMVLSLNETTLLLFSFHATRQCTVLSISLLFDTYLPLYLSPLQVALLLRSMVRCEQWPTEHQNAFRTYHTYPLQVVCVCVCVIVTVERFAIEHMACTVQAHAHSSQWISEIMN